MDPDLKLRTPLYSVSLGHVMLYILDFHVEDLTGKSRVEVVLYNNALSPPLHWYPPGIARAILLLGRSERIQSTKFRTMSRFGSDNKHRSTNTENPENSRSCSTYLGFKGFALTKER